jgi:hypothetical protein
MADSAEQFQMFAAHRQTSSKIWERRPSPNFGTGKWQSIVMTITGCIRVSDLPRVAGTFEEDSAGGTKGRTFVTIKIDQSIAVFREF